jgi:hypothetical protein
VQIITNAIRESVSTNSIVTIDEIDMRRAGVSVDAVRNELRAECEGDVVSRPVHEFWGRNVDGEEWRVHVALVEPAVTDRQITALREEFGEVERSAFAELSEADQRRVAAMSRDDAWTECERVIRNAQAQA